jgi:hypothetical protein
MHFDFEPKTWLKAPPMALVLEHIYGVQTADRRHSILYAHFSMNPEQLKSELTKTKSVGIQDTLSVDPSQNSHHNAPGLGNNELSANSKRSYSKTD